LTVDKGCITQPPHGYEINRWEDLLNHTDQELRPKVVIEIWSSNAQTWEKGPAGKACRERWRERERGYVSRFRRVDTTQVGGAIQQVRFISVRVKEEWASYWQWPEFEKDAFQVRSMSNLLTPPGLVAARDYGTLARSCYIPDARTEPMPNRPYAGIKAERGTRRLQFDETAWGLGLPKEWKWDTVSLDHGLLSQTTSLFLWEYLSETLSDDSPNEPPPPPRLFRPVSTRLEFQGPSAPPAVPPFSWIPPNLIPGGALHDPWRFGVDGCGMARQVSSVCGSQRSWRKLVLATLSLWLEWLWSRERLLVSSGTRCFRCRCTCHTALV
jgi:hypothetical protein